MADDESFHHQPSGTDLVETIGRLQSLLLDTADVQEFLTQVAGLAAVVIGPATSCGITARYDGHPVTVVTSDERAAPIDEHQYAAGQGPCLEAMTTGRIVEVTDQRTDPRWESYRQRAIDSGVRSGLSLPLSVEGRTMGAINLYNFERADAFGAEERVRAEAFALQASTDLTLALRLDVERQTNQQLEQALASRTVIDQAICVLMAEQRCDAGTAFGLLRKHSQNNNLKLRDVAWQIITRISGHPPGPSHAFATRRPGHSP